MSVPLFCLKILSFTHPQVVPNLCEFLSSAEHKRRYFELFLLCSAEERNAYVWVSMMTAF